MGSLPRPGVRQNGAAHKTAMLQGPRNLRPSWGWSGAGQMSTVSILVVGIVTDGVHTRAK